MRHGPVTSCVGVTLACLLPWVAGCGSVSSKPPAPSTPGAGPAGAANVKWTTLKNYLFIATYAHTLKIQLALEKPLEGRRALKGQTLTATTVEPLWGPGFCEVIPAGAPVQVLVEDAVAPLKGGKPGEIKLRLTQVTLADGTKVQVEFGGVFLRTGEDKTDQGKKFWVLPRKGGPAVIIKGETLSLPFLAAPAAGRSPAGNEPALPRYKEITLPSVRCKEEDLSK